MREVAKRPEKDRRELFRSVAQAMRVHEAVIEKDFWVCWVLDYLFQKALDLQGRDKPFQGVWGQSNDSPRTLI